MMEPEKTLGNPSTALMWVGKAFRLLPPPRASFADAAIDVTSERNSTFGVLAR